MVAFIRFGLAWCWVFFWLAGPVVAAPPAYVEEEVHFGPAQAQLAGTLSIPAGQGPFAAVVLLTDQGALDRNELADHFAPLALLADDLARHGLVVLRFDPRGMGQSAGNAPATMAERVADARTALNFLRTRPDVDLGHLGLIGHGQGSSVALLAAAMPLPPAFVVGLAPYGLSGAEVALYQLNIQLSGRNVPPTQVTAALKGQQAAQEVVQRTPDNAQALALLVPLLRQSDAQLDEAQAQRRAAEMVSPAYRDFLAFSPVEALPRVKCPVLLLEGTADQSLQTEPNLQALSRGLRANSSVTVQRLPGVNHLLQPSPAQWPLLNGVPRPDLSPALEEVLQAWLLTQVRK